MVMGELELKTDLLVVGAGPGGYAAAFRAADLGLDVTLVDTAEGPGGACMFDGCLPSKTLLFLAGLIGDAARAAAMGLHFGAPRVDLAALRAWKDEIVRRQARNLATLIRRRNIQFIRGQAEFESSTRVRLRNSEVRRIAFGHCVLATGSRPTPPEGAAFTAGGRIMSPAQALELSDIPGTLLVIGAGYAGLELGSLYAVLGSRVELVEAAEGLLPGADRDLVAPLEQRLGELFGAVHTATRVTALHEGADGVTVEFNGAAGGGSRTFDRVLAALGRRPNSAGLGLENTRVSLSGEDFVLVDEQRRTGDPRIFAAGDVTGGVLLAHKAVREGKVAAEVIAGRPSAFDPRAVPAVVYTDPQIAWCGLGEEEARREGRAVSIRRFPWELSDRAASMGAALGLTKIIADAESGRILGMGICGRQAEALIAEGVLAVEMGALVEDLALSIHPHPSLSETEEEAAEIFLGSATHVFTEPREDGDSLKPA